MLNDGNLNLKTFKDMEEKEILEGNKLIAEFMMCKEHHLNNTEGFYMDHPIIEWHSYGENNSEFHSSWDWLMPVVEKIEKLGYYIQITYYKDVSCVIGEPGSGTQSVNVINRGDNCVYKSAVEFIKWYNQQNP
jgi:hypothetical protein